MVTEHNILEIDGFGSRRIAADPHSGEKVEILDLAPSLVEHSAFVNALGERVARFASVRHTSYAHLRRLDRPAEERLELISDLTPGWRLSELLDETAAAGIPVDINVFIGLMRQLLPAVALYGRHNRDSAIGALAPERLLVTPQARLVIAEHAFGPSIDKLNLGRDRLWKDFRISMPPSTGLPKANARADAMGIGVIGLSVLLGRVLTADEFPDQLKPLAESVQEYRDGKSSPITKSLLSWLLRALHVDPDKGFQAPSDAQLAFETVLISERSYVLAPAAFQQWVGTIGGRIEARRPVPPPPEPEPAPAPVPETVVVPPAPQLIEVIAVEEEREESAPPAHVESEEDLLASLEEPAPEAASAPQTLAASPAETTPVAEDPIVAAIASYVPRRFETPAPPPVPPPVESQPEPLAKAVVAEEMAAPEEVAVAAEVAVTEVTEEVPVLEEVQVAKDVAVATEVAVAQEVAVAKEAPIQAKVSVATSVARDSAALPPPPASFYQDAPYEPLRFESTYDQPRVEQPHIEQVVDEPRDEEPRHAETRELETRGPEIHYEPERDEETLDEEETLHEEVTNDEESEYTPVAAAPAFEPPARGTVTQFRPFRYEAEETPELSAPVALEELDAPETPPALRAQAPTLFQSHQAAETAEVEAPSLSSRPLLLMGAVIVLLLAVIGWMWLRPGSGEGLASGEGELAVTTRIPGATLKIDGKDAGATPATLRLSPGPHVLEVQIGSGEPRVVPVMIKSGVQTAQYVELQEPTPVQPPKAPPEKARKR